MIRACLLTLSVLLALPASALAAPMTHVAGPYRLMLDLKPAEPFVTADQVKHGFVKAGMLVVGGARPMMMDSPAAPNHHLVLHVFDRTSGMAVQHAAVTMAYAPIRNVRRMVKVPVVEMQMAGKGAMSTHYGNNVKLAPGTYAVDVTVNGETSSTFTIRV